MTMQINASEVVLGVPMLRIRRFLAETAAYRGGTFKRVHVEEFFGKKKNPAQAFLRALRDRDLIQQRLGLAGEGTWVYDITETGRSFVRGKATKRIKRSTAQTVVTEFLSRVTAVNDNNDFAYKVGTVGVFGSYLRDNDTLGDVDFIVDLLPRYGSRDTEEQKSAEAKRITSAFSTGRRFSNFTEELFWPKREVILFLRNRKRSISIHDTYEIEHMERRDGFGYKLLFGDPTPIRRAVLKMREGKDG